MRISDLISLGSRYLILGGMIAVFVTLAILIIHRLLFKGKKKISKTRVLWWGLFVCYITVVLGATLMERGTFWQNAKIMPLFYSYKAAWVNGLAVDWRNIILNICMFMPLGFLLPLGFKCFKSFWITSLIGFLLTIIIEGIQLYYHLGMFELDDLMNNTIGTMIGFGFYALYTKFILKRTINQKKIILSQIPLVVTLIAFGYLFAMYHTQELGNIPFECILPFEKNNLSITSNTTFSDEEETAAVYKCVRLSKEETATFAKKLFERLGTNLDESRNDYYDETAVFYAADRYSLWINYKGGDYRLTDFNSTFNEKLSVNMEATEDDVKEALIKYGISIPSDVHMEINEETEQFVFTFQNYKTDSCFLDGSIMVEYMNDGSISSLNYGVVTCDLYKELPIISESEAYDLLCDGYFNYQMLDELKFQVESCKLEYIIDSKGFYQPYYQFTCNANDRTAILGIPAIKK